jgi:carboxyl-terminal processing protease
MTHFSRNILILTLGIFIGVGVTLERTVFAERKDALEPLPLEELHNFAEIFGRIKSDYVEQVDDKKLIEDAIQGMLSGLDPHSAYLTPESYKEVRIGTEGEFGGLGIEVSMENGFVKVVSPIDDTPAQRAGMRAGDLIIRINDQAVKGLSLNDAVQQMRGKPGTDITLTLVRDGVEAPFEVTLTRAVIVIRSVRSRLLEDGYAYVRISQFQANTADAMRSAIGELKKESGDELKGLVLDLRNNPGGVLNAAVAVSDAFLEKGKIVYTEGRVQDSQLTFNATPGDFINHAPMVVLVNEGSASASEIVAGALQDQKRAVIMGTKTFGKGSVQTILPMRSGAALKITTARYYTPGGRSIQAKGIEPDVVVEDLKVSRRESKGTQPLREADLSGHLENATVPPGASATGSDATTQAQFKPEDDYQLNEALNLLKGVNIVRAQGKT